MKGESKDSKILPLPKSDKIGCSQPMSEAIRSIPASGIYFLERKYRKYLRKYFLEFISETLRSLSPCFKHQDCSLLRWTVVPVSRLSIFLLRKGKNYLITGTWCHLHLSGLPKAKEFQIVPVCSRYGCCHETVKSGERRSPLII